jgi:hypothetical protein
MVSYQTYGIDACSYKWKGIPSFSKDVFPFVKNTLTPYDYCFFGKHHNVHGPIEVESLNGHKYFVTFIDDS